MQYNYEAIAEELLIKFEKRLDANQKAVHKQMAILFDFLGDRLPFVQRKDLELVINDILSDKNKSHTALFTETLNKIIRTIREITHE
jgi:hypothetical protein